MKNEKGFTLIEVIVSAAVGSIILGIVLSLLVTSFRLFNQEAKENQTKQTNDNVIEYISEVIDDASDLRIKAISNASSSLTVPSNSTNLPVTKLSDDENWHYLFINSAGRLVIDGEVMFGGSQASGFYGSTNTKLSLSYQVHVDTENKKAMSLDLTTILDNTSSNDLYKEKYKKTNTVDLNNIVTKTYQEKITDNANEGKLTDGKNGVIDKNHIIYFANEKKLNVQPVVEATYTVADKLNLISDSTRNKGQFQATYISNYQPGDIVSYNGFTYMRTSMYDVDFYTRTTKSSDIKEAIGIPQCYIMKISDGTQFYVHKDYVKKETSGSQTHYSYQFKSSNGNKVITCAPITDETTGYFKMKSDVTSDDPIFNVVLNYKEGNNDTPTIRMMLAPGAHIKLGNNYAYAGWEKLANTSFMNAPTETPQPAQFDKYSTYIPGDLVIQNGYLYYIQQMSLSTTQTDGHTIADENSNVLSEKGTYYGTSKTATTYIAVKIGKYEEVLETMTSSPDQNHYLYKVPSNRNMKSIIQSSRTANGQTQNLQYWWKLQNNQPGYYASLPQR
ncbi:type II secretion system protein [Sharpea azabuensis]|uniref:type II secretion system protein n=1 Tax=Sharpea azabuensis TaxID=322505 RepID=UPI00240A0C69|nr:type II secretion system protein [Sharpea azabuensis]MDD6513178.1 type II secretion system protein [Sharpea azabuensis]